MRIVYLLESAGLWGGVKAVLEAANLLHERGHEVTVLCRGPAPQWMALRCAFQQVERFAPEGAPEADVVVATYWTTVAPAIALARGAAVVHYCQGYEGAGPENARFAAEIAAAYQRPETVKVTISPHLTRLLRERLGCAAREVPYAIDHQAMFPGPARSPSGPVRVGLVGPWEVCWKDLRTGWQACALAQRAGLDLVLVRAANTALAPEEYAAPFPVEAHVRVEPSRMGALYRGLDVFVGSSWGIEEGFFLPAVEAMACGVPCVLTDIPCHRGYGSRPYALFAPPRDPAALAEALVVAAKHPGVRQGLRAHGLSTARAFRHDRHIQALEQVLEDVAEAAAIRAL